MELKKLDATDILRISDGYFKIFKHTIEESYTNNAQANESKVEQAWQNLIKKHYNNKINFEDNLEGNIQTDGYVAFKLPAISDDSEEIVATLLLEAKWDEELTIPTVRARIMAQLLHYLYKIKIGGKYELPKIIMAVDRDECFLVWTKKLLHYLNDSTYNWEVSPREAYDDKLTKANDHKLVEDLVKNDTITAPQGYYKLVKAEDANELFDRIDSLLQTRGEYIKIKIDEHSVGRELDKFQTLVISNRDKNSSHDKVALFVEVLKGDPSGRISINEKKGLLNYQLNNTSNVVIQFKINAKNYKYYIDSIDTNISVEDVYRLDEMFESLIADDERRRKGDFYTPRVWADKTHEYLEDALGKDWASAYTIWDSACGTKNLTRDIPLKYGIRGANIYSSTLMPGELNTSERYNSEGYAFPFDYLNDGYGFKVDDDGEQLRDKNNRPIGSLPLKKSIKYYNRAIEEPEAFQNLHKIPASLYIKLYENQPILFYTNPPYATSTDNKGKEKGREKGGTSLNNTRDAMLKDGGYDKSAQNLYAQFYYRTLKIIEEFNLTNAKIAWLTPIGFLQSNSFTKLTNEISKLGFIEGFMFNASDFDGVKADWSIGFTIWGSNKQNNVKLDLLEMREAQPFKIGKKELTITPPEQQLSKWMRKNIKKLGKKVNYPIAKSAFNFADENSKTVRGTFEEFAIGDLGFAANNVAESSTGVNILTTGISKAHDIKLSLADVVGGAVAYSVRKVIRNTWFNNKDEYRIPTEEVMATPEFKIFEQDCLLYSVFGSASYQVAHRNIDWKGETFNISNEWFWHDSNYVEELCNNSVVVMDIIDDINKQKSLKGVYGIEPLVPYVSAKLDEWGRENLSSEAQAVLKYADDCLKESIAIRKEMIETGNYEKYSIEAWDAGFAQMKEVHKVVPLNSFDLLQQSIKALANKIERGVYTFKFLDEVLLIDSI